MLGTLWPGKNWAESGGSGGFCPALACAWLTTAEVATHTTINDTLYANNKMRFINAPSRSEYAPEALSVTMPGQRAVPHVTPTIARFEGIFKHYGPDFPA